MPHNDRDFDDSLKKLMVDLVGTAGGVGKTLAAWLDFLNEDKSLAEKVISGFNGQAGIAESLAEWLKEGMDE